MNAHVLLIGIACLCWLIASFFGFWPVTPERPAVGINFTALGLLFYGIDLLIR